MATKNDAIKFKRASRARKNTKDEKGFVRIQISLLGQGRGVVKKGNVVRSIILEDTKVSEVFDYLDKIF